jgi:hypothetical protein
MSSSIFFIFNAVVGVHMLLTGVCGLHIGIASIQSSRGGQLQSSAMSSDAVDSVAGASKNNVAGEVDAVAAGIFGDRRGDVGFRNATQGRTHRKNAGETEEVGADYKLAEEPNEGGRHCWGTRRKREDVCGETGGVVEDPPGGVFPSTDSEVAALVRLYGTTLRN